MMSEKLKIAMIKQNMTGIDLAEALGCSSQNVYALLKKDNWTEKQLKAIADKMNCELEINFRLRDTGEKLF